MLLIFIFNIKYFHGLSVRGRLADTAKGTRTKQEISFDSCRTSLSRRSIRSIGPVSEKQKKHVEFAPDWCSFNRNSEITCNAGTGALIDGHAFAAPNRPAEVLDVVYGPTWHVPREYW